jgi:sugar O-acyltransferase (sialic acid O-acetyltransferase NeuD family)
VTELVVVGGGGHGRELIDVIRAINAVRPTWTLLGVVDDDPGPNRARLDRLGVRLLGTLDRLEERPCAYALGIGTSSTRRLLAERLERAGCTPTTLVHPGASVGSDTRLADGVVVFDRTVVTTDVHIGRHTHLNVGCAVQHDTVVGEFVQFSPGVMVNGDCVIEDDVFLGTAAAVTRGCVVGTGARVGAGAVVLGNVPAGMLAVGIPAVSRPV